MYIIATGRMVYAAVKIIQKLSHYSIHAGLIDLFRLKPINEKMLWKVIKKAKRVITLEEHFLIGGMADAISGLLAGKENAPLLKSIGIKDQFCREYGDRKHLQCLYHLDIDSVAERIREWIRR